MAEWKFCCLIFYFFELFYMEFFLCIRYNDVGGKRYFDPLIPTDCFALCALVSYKKIKFSQ